MRLTHSTLLNGPAQTYCAHKPGSNQLRLLAGFVLWHAKTIHVAGMSPATARAKTRKAIKSGRARVVAQTFHRAIGRRCATIASESTSAKMKLILTIKTEL